MELSLTKVIVIIAILGTVAYFGNQIKSKYTSENFLYEYKLVKEYVLNESPIYSHSKPKIWIHTKYELNARKWRDFGTRNTTDLNQPYLHLTIQSMIRHCGNDFHILLIDDDSFPKLLDDWSYDLSSMHGKEKDIYRQYALAKMIWKYGGILVPNSYLCLHSLLPVWNQYAHTKKPFVFEMPNRTSGMEVNRNFVPDMTFLGCGESNNEKMMEFLNFLYKRVSEVHKSAENEFEGDIPSWLHIAVHRGIFDLISGDVIGVKTNKRNKPICIEDWMEEKDIDLSEKCCGIFIPAEEILRRPKYQWFASLHTTDILKSNMILSKYMRQATLQEPLSDDSGVWKSDSCM